MSRPVRLIAQIREEPMAVEVREEDGLYVVTLGGEEIRADIRTPRPWIYSVILDGASYLVEVRAEDGEYVVDVEGEEHRIQMEERTHYLLHRREIGSGRRRGQTITAPMPGKVVHIAVQVGQEVKPGDGIVVVEAMKMENELRATTVGTIKEVRVQTGQAVNAGDVLIVIE